MARSAFVVSEHHGLEMEALPALVAGREPFIVRDIRSPFRSWSLEQLEETHGELLIRCIAGNPYTEKVTSLELPLREYLAQHFHQSVGLDAPAPPYIEEYNPAFLEQPDFRASCSEYTGLLPAANVFGRGVFLSGVSPWIGPGGSRTPLHCDHNPGVLFQVYGRKTLTLWRPSDPGDMVPSRRFEFQATPSDVDVFRPETLPAGFEHVPRQEITLEPGDALHIPAHVWHAVTNPEPSIAYTLWGSRLIPFVSSWAALILHDLGLYRRRNCTCHQGGYALRF